MFSQKSKNLGAEKLKKYELAVKSCYPERRVLSLRFFRFECFNRFNFEYQSEKKQYIFHEDNFTLHGIVGGESAHVPVELKVRDFNPDNPFFKGEELGEYRLNLCGHEKDPPENRPIMLDVGVNDPEKKYRGVFRTAMRDAAVSGVEFLHVELHGLTFDLKDSENSLDLINERGYGPHCTYKELKLWPEITLPNTPPWAIQAYQTRFDRFR